MFASTCLLGRVCVANVVVDIVSHVFVIQYHLESVGVCLGGDWDSLALIAQLVRAFGQ